MFWTRKRCLIGIPIWGYQNFYSLPPKNWILGPKTAKFGPKLAFWAKYWHFWPTWSNAWPKNNADKLFRWFSVMLVPKLLLTPIKIRIFGPKTAEIGPKYAFLVILGQILAFLAHFLLRFDSDKWDLTQNIYALLSRSGICRKYALFWSPFLLRFDSDKWDLTQTWLRYLCKKMAN